MPLFSSLHERQGVSSVMPQRGDNTTLGSDGRSTGAHSLTSNEDIDESETTETSDNFCTDDTIEHALKYPQTIKWKLPARQITIMKGRHPSFGIQWSGKFVTETDQTKICYLLVKGVKPGSPAAATSLRRGDSILSLNNQPTLRTIETAAEWMKYKCHTMEIFQEADNDGIIRLYVQSPGKQTQTSGNVKCPTMSEIGSPISRPQKRPFDVLSYLENIERHYRNATFSETPYCKIVILGKESISTAARLFGIESVAERSASSIHTQRLQREGFLIHREEVENTSKFRLEKYGGTRKTWMRSPTNLKQCLDAATESRVNGSDQKCSSRWCMYVDVTTLRYEDSVSNAVAASLCMSENDVIVYQVDGSRLKQNTFECSQELRTIVNRAYGVHGHIVRVIVAITSQHSESHDQTLFEGIIERLHQYNCIIVKSVFINLTQGNSSGPSLDSGFSVDTVGDTLTEYAAPYSRNNGLSCSVCFDVIEEVWKHRNCPKYPTRFLRYLELFWRMIDTLGQQGALTKRKIQDACYVADQKDVSDFITFLRMMGEILIVHAGSVHETIVLPSSILPSLHKLLKPPSDEQSHPLRAHWKVLTSLGVVTSILLEQICGPDNVSTTISTLQEVNVLLPLSRFAVESNSQLKRISKGKEEFFFVKYALKPTSDCQCNRDDCCNELRVKFESQSHGPPDFMQRFVFQVVDNLKDKDLHWDARRCGCFGIITSDGLAMSLRENSSSDSITISALFSNDFKPVDLLRLIRKSAEDLVLSKSQHLIVGCSCPICEAKGEVHVLDIKPDMREPFVHCGMHLLNDDPRVRYWYPRPPKEVHDPREVEWPTFPSMDSWPKYPSIPPSIPPNQEVYPPIQMAPPNPPNQEFYPRMQTAPDSISNLSADIYFRLCQRLNVLDSSFLDWRMLAAKLGYSTEYIRMLNNTACPDWNACDRLLNSWKQRGGASITGLLGLLIEIKRNDIATDLLRECGSQQRDLLDRIDQVNPGKLASLWEKLDTLDRY